MTDLIANGEKLLAVRQKLNATLRPYASRAEFEAATIPAAVTLTNAIDGGNVVQLVRDPAGTWTSGDGAKWKATILTAIAIDDLEALRDEAQAWAEGTLPGGAGTKSAKEHATAAGASATQAALYDGPWLGNVAALLADNVLSYTSGAGKTVVAVGSYVRTRSEGFAYQVAASGASDQHVTTAGGVKLYVQAGDNGLNVKAFGATGDNTTNDAPFFSAAILAFAVAGGGRVFAPADTYKLSTTIIIPSNVELDLCNSVITGPGIGSATDLFRSGYLTGGALVTNIGSPPETILVTKAAVKNATINNCGKAFNLYNWIDNSEVSNIKFNDCTYAIYADRCFYARFVNLFSRGSASAAANAAFYFTSFVNVCQIESVFVTSRALGIEVASGANGQVLLNCSAEDCATGIKVSEETGPLKFDTCYIEACSSIGVDLQTTGYKYDVTFENCWFYSCGTGIRGTASGVGSNITVRENNRFGLCATNFDGADATASYGSVEIDPAIISNNGYPLLPTGWTLGEKYRVNHENILFDSSTGSALMRSKVHGTTLVPFHHEGNAGGPRSGTVAFCEHSKSVGTSFSVYVDTKITYSQYANFLAYRFAIADNNATSQIFGQVFGDQVKVGDATGVTVSVSNNGGFVRLTLGTFSHPTEFYSITGVVRHM